MLSKKSSKSIAIRKTKLTKNQIAKESWQYDYDKEVQLRQSQSSHNNRPSRMQTEEESDLSADMDGKPQGVASKVTVDEESVEVDPVRLQYGASCSQGMRQYMEDRRAVVLSVPGRGLLKKWAFFGVFDGHRGQTIATFCSEKLLETIIATLPFTKHDKGDNELDAVNEFRAGIRQGFLELDRLMKDMTDDNSGSTAAVILISPAHAYFANCGDSRSLFYWDGVLRFATEDHKPAIAEEASRILKAGGIVKVGERDCRTLRVNGTIALSRAFGDYDYKQNYLKGPTKQMIIAEPDVTVYPLPPSGKGFFVIVSDGIHEKIDSSRLVAHVAHNLKLTCDHNKICDRIVEACFYKNGKDNMTVILVSMGYTSKCISKIEQRKNWNIETFLKKRIADILESKKDATLYDIIKEMKEQVNDMMPPEGLGIYSKIDYMNKTLRRYHSMKQKKDKASSNSK